MDDKILLVDDDHLILECFERMLRRHFNLDTALGPAEALDAISTRGPYTVVVSDMRMPHLNGVQFLLKAKELDPNTIGIVLSGNLDETEAEAAGKGVIFRVLAKPCPYDHLVNVIKEAMNCHREGRN